VRFTNQRRLRAGWRILIQLAIMTTVALAVTVHLIYITPPESTLSPFGLLAAQISTFIAINLSVFLARRYIDRRTVTSLGLQIDPKTARDLLTGFVIAGVMMLSIYLIEVIAGWLNFRGFIWQRFSITETIVSTLGMLALFIIVGWQEELLSHGYQLQNMAED
jgi:hypothetical protein